MKVRPSQWGKTLAALVGACLTISVSQAATTVVGSGADTSFLVLNSPNLGERTYEIHYTYDSGGSQDAYFLLQQVIASDASLVVTVNNFGTLTDPNFFVSSINGEANTTAPPYLYWAHWVAGGNGYQNPDYTFNPGPVAEGEWSIGYGVSTHQIAPGSWDALVFSDGSVLPVPETSSLLIGVAGALVFLNRRRRG